GADLSGAILQGANLRGAHLDGANLEGALLQGASLAGASGLTQTQLQNACADRTIGLAHTGLAFPRHRPCCDEPGGCVECPKRSVPTTPSSPTIFPRASKPSAPASSTSWPSGCCS